MEGIVAVTNQLELKQEDSALEKRSLVLEEINRIGHMICSDFSSSMRDILVTRSISVNLKIELSHTWEE